MKHLEGSQHHHRRKTANFGGWNTTTPQAVKSVCFNYVVYVKSTPWNSLSHFLLNACCLANSPENWHNQSTQHMHAVKELCHYHTGGMTCLGRKKTTETFIRFLISKAPKVTSKLPVTKTCSTFHISRSHLYRQKKYLHHLSVSAFCVSFLWDFLY